MKKLCMQPQRRFNEEQGRRRGRQKMNLVSNSWVFERFLEARPDYIDNTMAVCSEECPFLSRVSVPPELPTETVFLLLRKDTPQKTCMFEKYRVCRFNEMKPWRLTSGPLNRQICFGWVRVLTMEIYRIHQEKCQNIESMAGYMLGDSIASFQKILDGNFDIDAEIIKA
jgi:hypothetical protein